MSIRCQSWVYENSEATGNDRLVLLAIADEADDDGTNGHPGIDRISHKARVPKRTTMRCLERLEVMGALVVNRPEVKGRGHFNTYIVVMGNDATLSPIPPPQKRRERARKGAVPYLDGSRPIDPLTQRATTEPTTSPSAPVDQVFNAWLASTKKTSRTVLDSTRRGLITKALATYPLPDVLDAVRGWENSPHHRGENDQKAVYNDLGLLLRDAGKIEYFRDLARGPRLDRSAPQGRRQHLASAHRPENQMSRDETSRVLTHEEMFGDE